MAPKRFYEGKPEAVGQRFVFRKSWGSLQASRGSVWEFQEPSIWPLSLHNPKAWPTFCHCPWHGVQGLWNSVPHGMSYNTLYIQSCTEHSSNSEKCSFNQTNLRLLWVQTKPLQASIIRFARNIASAFDFFLNFSPNFTVLFFNNFFSFWFHFCSSIPFPLIVLNFFN